MICDYTRSQERPRLKFRAEVFSALAYFQLNYLLVFVTDMLEERVAEVLAILEEENIVPDAIYQIQTGEKRVKWGLDYSKIYEDLHLSAGKIDQNTAIIAPMSANYSELGRLIEGRIVPYCHCLRIPLPTQEYPKVPVTVLIPHLLLQDSGSSSSTLLSLIINEVGQRFDLCSKRIAFPWLDRLDSFPHKRLWMSCFSTQEQVSSKAFWSGEEACCLLVVKMQHVKPNFEVGFRRHKIA